MNYSQSQGGNKSQDFRKLGNTILQSITKTLAPVIQESRYQEASNLYYQSLQYAVSYDDIASSNKNLAFLFSQQMKRYFNISGQLNQAFYYCKHAIKHLKEALNIGIKAQKSKEWIQDIQNKLQEQVIAFLDNVYKVEFQERVNLLREFSRIVEVQKLKIEILIKEVEIVFNHSVEQLEMSQYNSCLNNLADCQFPLNQAFSFANGDQSYLEKCESLRDSIFMHQCMAEAIKQREQGDNILQQALSYEEEISIEQVWVAVDFYRQSIVLARERDIENEAYAYERLGRIFYQVLKQEAKAKTYYHYCIQLANSQRPRDMSHLE